MIRLVVTRGYGNGTFLGDIPHVTTRGYAIGQDGGGGAGQAPRWWKIPMKIGF